jgi:hypothetical protein
MNELISKSRELTKRYQTSTSSCFQKFFAITRVCQQVQKQNMNKN